MYRAEDEKYSAEGVRRTISARISQQLIRRPFRFRECPVKIAVQLEPALGMPGEVSYRWDPDTDILSAQLPAQPGVTEGMSGSVGLEGSDGSWLILDVNEGRINGVEVAVWPDVRELAKLPLPSKIEDAAVTVPGRKSQPDIASVEMAARNIVAEADQGGKNFHFRMGQHARDAHHSTRQRSSPRS